MMRVGFVADLSLRPRYPNKRHVGAILQNGRVEGVRLYGVGQTVTDQFDCTESVKQDGIPPNRPGGSGLTVQSKSNRERPLRLYRVSQTGRNSPKPAG